MGKYDHLGPGEEPGEGADPEIWTRYISAMGHYIEAVDGLVRNEAKVAGGAAADQAHAAKGAEITQTVRLRLKQGQD